MRVLSINVGRSQCSVHICRKARILACIDQHADNAHTNGHLTGSIIKWET